MSVQIDDRETIEFITNLPKAMEDSINEAVSITAQKTASYAKTNHRFKSRTGKLLSAIGVKSKDLGYDLTIDNKAQYGLYVHTGHGSWAPDEFMFNAADALSDELDKQLDKAVDQTLKGR